MINWKTTLFGVIGATLGILQAAFAAYQDGKPVNWLQVAAYIALAAFAYVAKDKNVTGAGPTAKTITKVTSVSLMSLALGVCLVVAACSYLKTSVLTATSSDGKDWPICVEWTENVAGNVWLLACGDASMTVPKLESEIMAAHPRAIVREVAR